MRGLAQLPPEYFDKFSDKPVKIKPYDPASKSIAAKYILELEKLLKGLEVEIIHKGSTAFGIAGKGEIEVGVYPLEDGWEQVLERLKQKCGEVQNLEENYARFNDTYEGLEVEVIVMKGEDAVVDKRLTSFLVGRPDLLKQYEKLKYKYAFSKKEYMIAKDKFFSKILEYF